MKRGDIQALGAFSYASPLISTLLLVLFGRRASAALALACLLIVSGAILAAQDVFRRWAPEASG